MKKIALIFLFGFLIGCSKEEEDDEPTPQQPTVAGVQLPSADAGLYTIIVDLEGDKNLQNSAWFETPNSSTDVGKVSYEIDGDSEDLRYILGNYQSVDFLPDNIDETIWTVEGENGFPGFTFTDNQSVPNIAEFSASASKIDESTPAVAVTNSLIENADYVIYGLVDLSNQLNNKYFPASTTSTRTHTFTNSDFTPFIQHNNGVKGIPFTVTALKYKTETVQGKTVLFVKQYTSWASVEVE